MLYARGFAHPDFVALCSKFSNNNNIINNNNSGSEVLGEISVNDVPFLILDAIMTYLYTDRVAHFAELEKFLKVSDNFLRMVRDAVETYFPSLKARYVFTHA